MAVTIVVPRGNELRRAWAAHHAASITAAAEPAGPPVESMRRFAERIGLSSTVVHKAIHYGAPIAATTAIKIAAGLDVPTKTLFERQYDEIFDA